MDLKRRGSDRSVNRHDTCRGAAYLNIACTRRAGEAGRSASEMTKRHQKFCVYCQTRFGTTDDHVPPAMLFPERRPNDLITVPACEICNASFQKDEEYFRGLFRHLQQSPSEATRHLWPKIDRMLARSPGLNTAIYDSIETADLLGPNGSTVGRHLTVEENWQRVVVVMDKIVRGLYFFEFEEALPLSTHINCPDYRTANFNLSGLYGRTKNGKRSWPRIFDYKFSRNEDEHEETVWVLRFYDGHLYIVFTARNKERHIEKCRTS